MSHTESSDSWQVHSEVSETYILEGHHGLEIDSALMCFGREFGEEKQNRVRSHTCDYRWGQRPGVQQLTLVAMASIALDGIWIKCHIWLFIEELKYCLPL